MAVAHHRPNGTFRVAVSNKKPALPQPRAHRLNNFVHLADRDGEVVLVDRPSLSACLWNALTKGPEGAELGGVLCENAVQDNLVGDEVFQQAAEFLLLAT